MQTLQEDPSSSGPLRGEHSQGLGTLAFMSASALHSAGPKGKAPRSLDSVLHVPQTQVSRWHLTLLLEGQPRAWPVGCICQQRNLTAFPYLKTVSPSFRRIFSLDIEFQDGGFRGSYFPVTSPASGFARMGSLLSSLLVSHFLPALVFSGLGRKGLGVFLVTAPSSSELLSSEDSR